MSIINCYHWSLCNDDRAVTERLKVFSVLRLCSITIVINIDLHDSVAKILKSRKQANNMYSIGKEVGWTVQMYVLVFRVKLYMHCEN